MTADPASPASPPPIRKTSAQDRSTFMPATRAAEGLAPTDRNSNPVVVRFSSHHTPIAHAIAIRNPALIRRLVPAISGRCALDAMGGVIELADADDRISDGDDSRYARKYAIT